MRNSPDLAERMHDNCPYPQKGQCHNFEYCATASTGRVIDIPAFSPYVCSECSKPLYEVDVPVSAVSKGIRLAAYSVSVLALAAALGIHHFASEHDYAAKVLAAETHSSEPAPVEAASPQAAAEPPVTSYYLRVSGAYEAGVDITRPLVKAWLDSQGASDIRLIRQSGEASAGAAPSGVAQDVIRATLNGQSIAVGIVSRGTSSGFSDLASGAADIALSSRPVSDAEAAMLKPLGDMRAINAEHVVALDSIGVIVCPLNKIAQLTTADLQNIYSGKLTNWSQLGGDNVPITVYALRPDSGEFFLFNKAMLNDQKLAPGVKIFDDGAKLEAAIAADPGGIGFVDHVLVNTAREVPLSDGTSQPLLPTPFSVKTESYPLHSRVYFYSQELPKNPAVTGFVNFALSTDGQNVVRRSRFLPLDLTVPQNARKAAPAPVAAAPAPSTPCKLSAAWPNDPDEYCALRGSAEQLPTSFHFMLNSSELDSKAVPDLKRVMGRMLQVPGKRLILAGFTDASGAYFTNCTISLQRARSVARAFATLGIQAEARGFCAELPVRSNATEAGRQDNRRVELFLQ